jgi:molecular chaperone GrpE
MGKETEENELDETGSQRASESEEVPDPEAQASDELQEALREKDQFRKMAQRAQADLINYRRRVEDDKADIRRNANSGLLLKVLSVNDDLERAVEHAPEGDEAGAWLDGLRLVRRNLQNVLRAEGVTRIEAEGRPFEPWEHEAVFHEATRDGKDGMVVRVIQDGYKLHDRVLRPARVTVSKLEEEDSQESTEQEEQRCPES